MAQAATQNPTVPMRGMPLLGAPVAVPAAPVQVAASPTPVSPSPLAAAMGAGVAPEASFGGYELPDIPPSPTVVRLANLARANNAPGGSAATAVGATVGAGLAGLGYGVAAPFVGAANMGRAAATAVGHFAGGLFGYAPGPEAPAQVAAAPAQVAVAPTFGPNGVPIGPDGIQDYSKVIGPSVPASLFGVKFDPTTGPSPAAADAINIALAQKYGLGSVTGNYARPVAANAPAGHVASAPVQSAVEAELGLPAGYVAHAARLVPPGQRMQFIANQAALQKTVQENAVERSINAAYDTEYQHEAVRRPDETDDQWKAREAVARANWLKNKANFAKPAYGLANVANAPVAPQ